MTAPKEKAISTALLIINPQVDFCHPEGKAFIPHADKDMRKLGKWITENVNKIDKIFITLDYHSYWNVFTSPCAELKKTLSDKEVREFIAQTSEIKLTIHHTYIDQDGYRLNGYSFDPIHCLKGSIGAAIVPAIEKAVYYQHAKKKEVEPFILQVGEKSLCDSHSAIKMNDAAFQATNAMKVFARKLAEYDRIIVAGEALTGSVLHFLQDWAYERDSLENVYLLDNCCSVIEDKSLQANLDKLRSLHNIYLLNLTSTKEFEF